MSALLVYCSCFVADSLWGVFVYIVFKVCLFRWFNALVLLLISYCLFLFVCYVCASSCILCFMCVCVVVLMILVCC